MKFLKLIFEILTFILLVLMFLYVYDPISSPHQNFSSKKSIHESIYTDKNIKKNIIKSMNQNFHIAYVENATLDSFNPYFPAIHISTDAKHNAWLHCVRVHGPLEYVGIWNEFVDTVPSDHPIYPFYCVGQDFYDAPLWIYSLLFKKSFEWIGHAYAVIVDRDEKIITCVGGISWGFKYVWWNLRPVMIDPMSLDFQNWQKDIDLFSKVLPLYQFNLLK